MIFSAEHEPSGFIRKYIFSTNHKMIGFQFLITAMAMAVAGAALAVLIRIQLAWPEQAVIKPETYLGVVTIHGTLMIFFVTSLGLFSGLGNYLIPLMIGAREMPFPRLNMLSYWVIVPACLLMLLSFLAEGGAAASGWTSYPTLSALQATVPGSGTGQTLWLVSMALFIVSFYLGGVNFLVTILRFRASGMMFMRMPLLIWNYLVATLLGLLAFPALIAAIVMLLMDRHLETSFFLPAGMIFGDEVLAYAGGTPLLFQHLFWFFGHPEMYVLALPALGILFEVISTFTQRPPFGYRISVYATSILAILSLLAWGDHMYVSGMNPYAGQVFSVTTMLITVPFMVLGLNLLLSLWQAHLQLELPMLFALSTISALGIGGLGGLYLGANVSDIYFHDSYFVVGHFHFMIGMVTLLSLFAAIYYWFPKMFGRMLGARLGHLHFWLTITSMFTMFILMHYQGFGGSLRRTYDPSQYEYTAMSQALNIPISICGFVAVIAQLFFLVNFFKSIVWGPRAEQNPWQSGGLEWTTETPVPHNNWGDSTPAVTRWPYDYEIGNNE